jgi:hypothetical protein
MSNRNATPQLKVTCHSQQCSKIDADTIDVGELFEVRKFRKSPSPFPRALINLAHSEHPIRSSNATLPLKIICHSQQCSKIDADTVGVNDLFEIRKVRGFPSHFPEALIALAHDHHPMSSGNTTHQLKIAYHSKQCSKNDTDTMDVDELFEVRDYRKLAYPLPRALIDLAHNHHPMSSVNATP